jgi:hypothetical protein
MTAGVQVGEGRWKLLALVSPGRRGPMTGLPALVSPGRRGPRAGRIVVTERVWANCT